MMPVTKGTLALFVGIAKGLAEITDVGVAAISSMPRLSITFPLTGYVLDSGSHKRLWLGRFELAGESPDDFVVGRGLDGHRLLDKTIKQLATAGRLSAVEAERELVEIVTEVFVADRALMGPREPAFQE